MVTERRASRRYELSFPIVVHETDFGQTCTYAAWTRNISVRGLHFILHRALEPGVAIEFTVTMSAEQIGVADVFIHGTGKVLWVAARRDKDYRIASSIERYEISETNREWAFR